MFIHSRDTVKGVTFEMFFATAKMALWWLPEVNNMCRLNAIHNIGGGRLSYCHNPSATGEEGVVEMGLTSQHREHAASYMCMASPVYENAFRFESMYHRGWSRKAAAG